MFAIIRSGGKQYKVQPGDRIRVEKLPLAVGAEVVLNEVLLVSDQQKTEVGQPTLPQASVHAVVTRQDKYPKVVIFKKKRRQGYRRTRGHRQPFTELFIKALKFGDQVEEAPLDQNLIKSQSETLSEEGENHG